MWRTLGVVVLALNLAACAGARPHPRGPEGTAGPQGPETDAPSEKAEQGQPAIPEDVPPEYRDAPPADDAPESAAPETAAPETRVRPEAAVAPDPAVEPAEGEGVLGAAGQPESATPGPAPGAAGEHDAALEVVAELDLAPGNVTVTPDGRIVVSLHPFFAPDLRVATVEGGELVPFPNVAWSLGGEGRTPRLDAVLGVQSDAEGVVWMLDTGLRGGVEPRLVGWDTQAWALAKEIPLGAVTPDDAFVNDLAVDSHADVVYIADPAGGANAALIVVDLATGAARRLLEGHDGVVPEDLDLFIDGRPVRRQRPDGSVERPRIGVDPIALDARNEWLYFGPMHGTTLWRIRTADLRDTALSAADLAGRVERFADKPICDGISMDEDGNVYVSDLSRKAVGVISPEGQYRLLVQDSRLSWPDAFSFGPDGWLYTVANQLHRSASLGAGTGTAEPPFLLLRLAPLAGGVTGR